MREVLKTIGFIEAELGVKVEMVVKDREETPMFKSPKFADIEKDWGQVQELAKLSLSGDLKAKRELNDHVTVSNLIDKINRFLEKDDQGLSETCTAMDFRDRLEESKDRPCQNDCKVREVKHRTVSPGHQIWNDGVPYNVGLAEASSDFLKGYGEECVEQLNELKDGYLAVLSNGQEIVKKDGILYKVNKLQLHKTRDFKQLNEELDISNGQAIRASAALPDTYNIISALKTYSVMDILVDLKDAKHCYSLNKEFDLPLFIEKLITKIKAYYVPEEQNDATSK